MLTFAQRSCIVIGYLCLWAYTAAAQDLFPPGEWQNTTSTLDRASREGLANMAAAALLSRVTPNGIGPDLPNAQYVTSAIAVLALQDYYSGNSSWYDMVNTSIESYNQYWDIYGENPAGNNNAIYWGLAYFYAYRAYRQQIFLDLAVTAYNSVYMDAFITTSDAVNGTGAGRNVTFKPPSGCTNFTIAGGVFVDKDVQDDTVVNSETVSPFMALSAYLYEESKNSTYKDAGQLSLSFITNHLWNGTIVYDTFGLSDCITNKAITLTYNQAWYIEGLSVWANVTLDDIALKTQLKTHLEDVVRSVTQVPYWNAHDRTGIITEGVDTDNVVANLKGIFIRGLTEARLRNPDTPLSQYIEAYITVQFNSLQNHARTGNDSYTTSWYGPSNPAFSVVGNIAALDVLNAAVLFATPNAPGPTTSSPGSSATGSSPVSPNHSAITNKSSNVGGIAGGAVAGVVAAFAATATYVIWRRRRKHVTVLDAVPERSDGDKATHGGSAPIIEPFVHPGAAPLAPTKLQRMNASFLPDYGDPSTSAPDHASSLIDLAESVPMLTSSGNENNNLRARSGYELAKAPVQPRAGGDSFNHSPPSGGVVVDTVTSAPSGDNTQEAGREQPLTLADLPALARHLYPLLQNQQAEHPPQYGP